VNLRGRGKCRVQTRPRHRGDAAPRHPQHGHRRPPSSRSPHAATPSARRRTWRKRITRSCEAYELDLPMLMTQRNPKTGASRQRYESYKSARCLRDATKLGANWSDIRWDFSRGWMDFSPTAKMLQKSHAEVIEALAEWRRLRAIDESSGSFVNEFGFVQTASQLGGGRLQGVHLAGLRADGDGVYRI
jgi:hypothetical protein